MTLEEVFSPDEIHILKARAARIAAPLNDAEREGRVTTLITVINAEKYALPIDGLIAVYQDVTIIPLPCVPDYVAGVANVRGHIVTVLDLPSLLGLTGHSDRQETALVVTEAEGMGVGFRVGTIGDVVELHMSEMEAIPTNISLPRPNYLEGIFPQDIFLLDLASIVNDSALVVEE